MLTKASHVARCKQSRVCAPPRWESRAHSPQVSAPPTPPFPLPHLPSPDCRSSRRPSCTQLTPAHPSKCFFHRKTTGVAAFGRFRHPLAMVDRPQALESLSAQERIALMGRLWDSLDPAAAAPLSPALAAELDHREAEADADPDAGIPWTALRDELRARLP
ncbi:MAG: addiction module protein [Gemmatimonadales bacterium]|nr:addiction module protein [Gemmatimonadales bacterium]